MDSIRQAAEGFVKARVSTQTGKVVIRAGRLDPRLKLSRCGHSLQTFSNSANGFERRVTVGVRCNQPRPWKLFVPVDVRRTAAVLVARKPLSPGDIVSREDFELAPREVNRLPHGYLLEPAAAIGQRVVRSVSVGEVVAPATLAAPKAVRRGQMVTLISHGRAIQVRAGGRH